MIVRRNAAGQFLSLVVTIKDVNKKYRFGDGLFSGSDVYMKQKSSYIHHHHHHHILLSL